MRTLYVVVLGWLWQGWAQPMLFDVLAVNRKVQQYKRHIDRCVEDAEAGWSALTMDILAMDGLTSAMTRHFYNCLLSMKIKPQLASSTLTNVRYLEVGTWKGSSLVSARFGNSHVHGTAIDNWSEYGGPRDYFWGNVERFLGDDVEGGAKVVFHDANAFMEGLLGNAVYDIYMYDGGHEYEAHRKAITRFEPYLADSDVSIVVIDDWNFA
ncbi:hypothetical protein JKP88DRAFT_255350 [Tribonema minus]|uniref:Class I SAM-dependent methyltransferase n=1 Tax=Tribonema minus TaxID=303371 RepID=A0A835Z1B4_9STRA|nr:hypothetical protein JKP88DRAFT_255350 [Tribonema minus]